jgi:DNA-binding MarR family transcriptional regulator
VIAPAAPVFVVERGWGFGGTDPGLDKRVVVAYNYIMEMEPKPHDLARELLQGIRGLVRRFSVAERADVACCGVTVAQGAALEALLAAGSMRLGALGRRLGIAPSTLTRNVERLEAGALVRREPDPEDARAFRIRLTAAGHRAAQALERQEVAFARQILERLPTGRREAVSAAFRDLLVAVREATESCCPGAFEHLMEALPRPEGDGEPRRPQGGYGCGEEGCGGSRPEAGPNEEDIR